MFQCSILYFRCSSRGLSQSLFFDREPKREGNRHPITYPVDSFQTKDGLIVLVVVTNEIFRKLGQAMGKPGLADDVRYADNNARNDHEKLLRTEISEWTESRTSEEILATLTKAEIPCAPLWSLGQAVESSHQETRKTD